MDLLRKYDIVINGMVLGSVRHGKRTVIEVQPGWHTIHMKIDWCSSRELVVGVGQGGQATLACASNANPFTAFFFVFFEPHNYISLSYA